MTLKTILLSLTVFFGGFAMASTPAPRSIEECMDFYNEVRLTESSGSYVINDGDAARACAGVYKECLAYTMAQSEWIQLSSALRACKGNVTMSCVERIAALPEMQYRANNRLDAANVCAGRSY